MAGNKEENSTFYSFTEINENFKDLSDPLSSSTPKKTSLEAETIFITDESQNETVASTSKTKGSMKKSQKKAKKEAKRAGAGGDNLVIIAANTEGSKEKKKTAEKTDKQTIKETLIIKDESMKNFKDAKASKNQMIKAPAKTIEKPAKNDKAAAKENPKEQESGDAQKPDNLDEAPPIGDCKKTQAGSKGFGFRSKLIMPPPVQNKDNRKTISAAYRAKQLPTTVQSRSSQSWPNTSTSTKKTRKSLIPLPVPKVIKPVQVQLKKQTFICQYCDRNFDREVGFKNHQLSHCHKIPDKDKRKLMLEDYEDMKAKVMMNASNHQKA